MPIDHAIARRRLPDERASKTAALKIGARKFYVTVGHYPSGRPGELFVFAGRGGVQELVPVELGPMLDWGAQMASIAMQFGAPLEVLLQKMRGTRFEPSGFTGDPAIPRATSPLDYLARKVAAMESIDLDGLGGAVEPLAAPARARLVYLESPFAPQTPAPAEPCSCGPTDVDECASCLQQAQRQAEARRNLAYARAAMADSLGRQEAPFASHLLYTQEGILRDDVAEERVRGMEAGFAWGRAAEATVVYGDLGLSRGMIAGIERAKAEGRPVERRSLAGWGL